MDNLTHKIRLYPTPEQEEYFQRAAGTARFVWNWALAEWNRQYEAGEKPSPYALKKRFNAVKHAEYPWTADIHTQAQQQPFADLGKAWTAYFRGLKAGRDTGRPSFKSRGNARPSFYLANIDLRFDGPTVRIPRCGVIRMAEALRFDGKIMSARVVLHAGRWHMAVSVEGDFQRERTGDGMAGLDVGIRRHIATDTGETLKPERPLEARMRRLKIRQRRLSRKQKGSNSRARARERVAQTHAGIANERNRALHHISKGVTESNAALAIETLDVKGMLQNEHIARALSDVALGELLRQIRYKAELYGVRLVEADRYFASTKTCSECGYLHARLGLPLHWTCPECGTRHDIDINAAKNLLRLLETREGG